MIWWHWLAIGLALAAAEMLTPGGFYFIFLGISGLLVGAALGLGAPLPTWAQVLAFCILSFALLILLRKRLQRWLSRPTPAKSGKEPQSDIVGEIGVAVEEIAAGEGGKMELRGTQWSARADGLSLAKGQRCKVTRVDGLTLWVRPE